MNRDARGDFDFLRGRWTVSSRRLQHPLFEDDEDWREFTMEVENLPVLGGLGNLDMYSAPQFPGRPDFTALALRLFDCATDTWRIWWASSVGNGQLDNPVHGGFIEDHGVFMCDDVLDGRALKVRFDWHRHPERPVWKQSFSFDGGRTWRRNWIMEWHRKPGGEHGSWPPATVSSA